MSHEKTQLLIIYSFVYYKQSTTCQWVGGVGVRLAETELAITGTDCHLIITTKMLISNEGATIYGHRTPPSMMWYTQYSANKLHSIATVI